MVLSDNLHDEGELGSLDLISTSRGSVGQERIEDALRDVLSFVGEDPNREGLLKTPHRVAESMKFLTRGYDQDVKTLLNGAVFHEEYDEMVLVKDIEFYSLCEHHLLPFFGKVHVAYLPKGHIVGLSKIPRLVDMFARRLQVQERLTREIADAIEGALAPRGVAVVVEGAHMCMMMRGVQKKEATMITSHVTGDFRTDRRTRQEFMALIKGYGTR
ncbi:MAG: GTP cyclohydrolase I FolE [Capsulimonadaceae bacterium]